MTNEKLSELLKELDQVVSKMDQENVSLEDSFDLYKKGIDLAGKCYGKLKVVEDRVIQVTGNDEDLTEEEISRDNDDISNKSKLKESITQADCSLDEDVDLKPETENTFSKNDLDSRSESDEQSVIKRDDVPVGNQCEEAAVSKDEEVEKKEENNLEFPGLFENH